MAHKEKRPVIYRNDMGLWNIIFAIEDTKSLKEYKKDNIGKLEKFEFISKALGGEKAYECADRVREFLKKTPLLLL